MNCKDCIHYQMHLCHSIDIDAPCIFFKDKSHFIELPCNIGDKFYLVYSWGDIEERECCAFTIENDKVVLIDESDCRYYADSKYFPEVFFTKEEAEARLKENENGTIY